MPITKSVKEITINGEHFSSMSDFYDEIESCLTEGLDWKIGRNLDALNDVLRGGLGRFAVSEEIFLVWKNHDKSISDLGREETIAYYENMLIHCHPSNAKYVKADLESARNGEGQMLFDIIVELIGEHEHIRLLLK